MPFNINAKIFEQLYNLFITLANIMANRSNLNCEYTYIVFCCCCFFFFPSVKHCDKNPCKNDGKCREKGKTFSCECKEPFYGRDCSESQ